MFKKLRLISLLIATFCVAVPCGTYVTGCASTPEKTAFNTEVGTRSSLSVAWTTFRQMRAQGKVSDDDWRTAANAVNEFKITANTVLDILQAYQKNPDSAALQSALRSVSIAWNGLYPVLVKYVPDLSKTQPALKTVI